MLRNNDIGRQIMIKICEKGSPFPDADGRPSIMVKDLNLMSENISVNSRSKVVFLNVRGVSNSVDLHKRV